MAKFLPDIQSIIKKKSNRPQLLVNSSQMNFPTHHLAAHAAYEHIQIDMHSGAYPDGVHPIYRYPDPGVTVSAVIGGGVVVDVTAVADNGATLEPIPPTDDGDAEITLHAMLRRAWLFPHRGQTLHAESWVNQMGEGFVDLFIRVG